MPNVQVLVYRDKDSDIKLKRFRINAKALRKYQSSSEMIKYFAISSDFSEKILKLTV